MPATSNVDKRPRHLFKLPALLATLLLGGAFFILLSALGSDRSALASPGHESANVLVSPSPTECAAGFDYVVTQSAGATIEPGTVRTGIDCRFNCSVTIDLPFPFTLYDRTFMTATIGSNGILGFERNDNPYEPYCLPSTGFSYAIVPDWELLVYRYSQPDPSRGVFTSVTGVAPNRIFNIEWRARDQFNVSPVDFEVRLYENSPTGRFDVIYAQVNHHGGHAVVGVQKDTGSRFTQFSCLTQGRVGPGVQLTFEQGECGTPVPATATRTSTNTPTPATLADVAISRLLVHA